ncbi:potassium-transporting ATPase subunit KdpC [bacterium]|nr:potassium-transporting ATPase subunit KdpC [bacterium]
MIQILRELRTATLLLVSLTVVTGAVYPALVTLVAHLAFPHAAAGSLIDSSGRPLAAGATPVGSDLVGQPFASAGYFWGRPSATAPVPCAATASGGSNLGPSNPALLEAVTARIEALRASGATGPVPVDLVTASASGLDPHITPAAAEFQVPRVARARKLSEEAVRGLVHEHTLPPQFGILGESRVHVMRLNLALDRLR